MPDRTRWVDYAKGLGIILVVYGHVARGVFEAKLNFYEPTFQLCDSIIYSFHMPLFFFLAGLFFYPSLQKRGVTRLIANKVDTIFYPYVLWSLLQGTIQVFLSKYTNSDTNISQVLELLWSPRAQFWFLHALFIIFGICSLLYFKLPREAFLFTMLAFALLNAYQRDISTVTPFPSILLNLVYFAAGVWFNEVKETLQSRANYWLLPSFALFVGAQWYYHEVLRLTWDHGGWLSLLLAAVSILFVVILCMVLSRYSLPLLFRIGSASMAIYLMHILVGAAIRIALMKIFHVQNVEVHLLVGCVGAVFLPLLAKQWMDRWNLEFLFSAPRSLSLEALVKL